MTKVIPNAEAIQNFQNNKFGILFLHGFTGNPAEFKYLIKMADDMNFSYILPRYPGHGTSMEEMIKTNKRDWFTAAREAYIEISSRCKTVYIVGHSMGACFTVLLSEEFNPEKIVLLSMPYEIKDWRLAFTSLMSKFIKVIPSESSASAILDPKEAAIHKGYEGTPVKQAGDLAKIVKQSRNTLKKIKSNVLIIQSSKDSAVGENAIHNIYNNIGSAKKKKSVYNRSEHVIMMDYDKEEVIKEINDFLK